MNKMKLRVCLPIFLAAVLLWPSIGVFCECLNGDCLNGKGSMSYPESQRFKKYTGQFKNGKRDGQGTMTGRIGDSYAGQWRAGKPHGHGTFIFPPGRPFKQYVGEFKNGTKSGPGTMTFSDGRIFTGEWKIETELKEGPAPEKFGASANAKYLWYKRYAVGTMAYPDGRKKTGTLMDNGEFIKEKK